MFRFVHSSNTLCLLLQKHQLIHKEAVPDIWHNSPEACHNDLLVSHRGGVACQVEVVIDLDKGCFPINLDAFSGMQCKGSPGNCYYPLPLHIQHCPPCKGNAVIPVALDTPLTSAPFPLSLLGEGYIFIILWGEAN